MTTLKRLLVFPNDPIQRYLEKGEVKLRYFNPSDLFDDVHIMTFTDAIPPRAAVQPFVGRATLVIHPLGSLRMLLSPMHPLRMYLTFRVIDRLVRAIAPSMIRGYNSALEGFLAVRFARRHRIPSIISLHTDRDEARTHWRGHLALRHRVYESVSRMRFEPYTVRHADAVITVSAHVSRYAYRYGAQSPTVISNRVDVSQFTAPTPRPSRSKRFRILAVGRFDPPRRQEHLIRAIRDLDAELVLIGDGVRRATLASLVDTLGMHDRVQMVPSVPHGTIQQWFWAADAFAHASEHEGHCHAVAEAMTSALPVVVSNHPSLIEEVGDAGIVVENTPGAFRDAFVRLQADPAFRIALGARARDRACGLWDGRVLEAREADVYRSLMGDTPDAV